MATPAGTDVDAVVEGLRAAGVGRTDELACCLAAGVGAAVSLGDERPTWTVDGPDADELVRRIEHELAPRWVVWSGDTARWLADRDVRVARCWDIAAVHRLVDGGWRADPARVWASLHGLDVPEVAPPGPLDLFTHAEADLGRADEPIGPDGHIRPGWTGIDATWTRSRLARWAQLAVTTASLQRERLAVLPDSRRALATARSESTIELLCAELEVHGLPFDRQVAEQIIGDLVGPRPTGEREALEQRRRRDAEVLHHSPVATTDLRNPAQVKSMFRSVGIELVDTRAWRLEALRGQHPLVDAVLAWRKAERISTTFGYGWIDAHVGTDGRLRGEWSGCDGAAGRMTATAGLHNMPALLRDAVVADADHVFVRADLGQIEPRVLAAVSGDPALAQATTQADLYAPVAAQLGVDRATAKVAVLGAMYGQTTGHGAHALRRLHASYPVAMGYLDDADAAARGGLDLRTFGGRRIRMASTAGIADERDSRSRAAAQGRYGRNAMVQGAAAELFKVWALIVRARGAALGAQIVLCLHDELVVHVPAAHGEELAVLVGDCLEEAAQRWSPTRDVHFIAEVGVFTRWSDAAS